MKRRIVGVTAAIALAGIGTLVLVAYVGAAEDRALAGERTVDVFVAAKSIERGTPADDITGSVEKERIPAKVSAEDVVTDLAALGDRVAGSTISPGEQITAARFVETSELNELGQVSVPDGMLQVTMSLSPERAVGGLIQPGSTVAVVASFNGGAGGGEEGSEGAPDDSATTIIVHKALVTTVQNAGTTATDNSDENQAPDGSVFVTLALSGPEVEQVVHTAEFGSVWLAFQPADAPEDAQIVTPANVLR